jgi:vesicle-associated membrane protein 7
MPIIYALVARGPTVLAEHASTTGNFAKVTQSILEKIPATNSKMSYVYDRCVGRSPRAPVRPPLG